MARFRQADATSRTLPFAGGTARWRISDGRLERSATNDAAGAGVSARTNAGTNAGAWIPVALAPGVEPGQLTAGSTAGGATWLVGRNGLVLVAANGTTFVRVTAPASADLVSVTATDARRAIVVVSGGRTFVTADAGQTWTPQ